MIIGSPFTRAVVDQFADTMCTRVRSVMLGSPETDQILSGGSCTGTVVLKSDKDICRLYAELARRLGLVGFSEESDRKFLIQGVLGAYAEIPMRVLHPRQVQTDPVDVSGDREFGKPGTPSGDGHTSLVSFLDRDRPVGGLCLRPAHGELWIFVGGEIELWRVDKQSGQRSRVPFDRPTRSTGQPELIRVNTRPAYPLTNLPQMVFDTATELSGGKYRFEVREAGGAGDCFVRLLRGELDLVLSGRKYDWKSWDRDPFLLPIEALGGELGTYRSRHEPSSRARRDDPWCDSGVMAHIGCAPAAEFLRTALAKHAHEIQPDGKPLLYRPAA